MGSDATAYKMIWKAAHLFKEHYGNYPERIGLDIQTRYQEFYKQCGTHFTIIEPERVSILWTEVDINTIPPQINLKRTEISIEPLVFPDLAAWELSRLYISHPSPDEVWCQLKSNVWGDNMIKMSIWFTEQGQHSIIWDDEDNNGER